MSNIPITPLTVRSLLADMETKGLDKFRVNSDGKVTELGSMHTFFRKIADSHR